MDRSKRPEMRSGRLESSSRARGARMSASLADAKTLTRELGELLAPGGGWQQQVSAIHRKLISPHFPWAVGDVTWSRVKTWFYGEARRIDYDHMVALKELKAAEEAQRAHEHFRASTSLVAAALAAEGTSLTCEQMEALERVAGRSAHVSRHHDARPGGLVRGMAGAGADLGGPL